MKIPEIKPKIKLSTDPMIPDTCIKTPGIKRNKPNPIAALYSTLISLIP